jgi:hypothetical protein
VGIGQVSSYQAPVFAGPWQNVAAVGSTFGTAPGVRRIRAEALTHVPRYSLLAPAFGGYASAEAIINLRVLDGSRVVASDRRGLGRAISVLFWPSEVKGAGYYTLACEFDGGEGRTYSVWAELETWAGGGGVAAVTAGAYAYVRQIVIRM